MIFKIIQTEFIVPLSDPDIKTRCAVFMKALHISCRGHEQKEDEKAQHQAGFELMTCGF